MKATETTKKHTRQRGGEYLNPNAERRGHKMAAVSEGGTLGRLMPAGLSLSWSHLVTIRLY